MAFTDPEPRPGLGATLGGCAATMAFLVLLLFPFFFAMAWGGAHCSPVPQCQRTNEGWFLARAAVAVPLALLLGLAVRALLHWLGRRNMEGDRAGGPPGWALIAAPLSIAAGIVWSGWA